MAESLVTIATYPTPAAADTARAALEAADVRAFLASAEFISMVWYLGNAEGHVRLKVAESDVALAREILAMDPGESHSGARCDGCGLLLDPAMATCPACGWSASQAESPDAASPSAPGVVIGHAPVAEIRGPLGTIRTRFRWLIWIWLLSPFILATILALAQLALPHRGVPRGRPVLDLNQLGLSVLFVSMIAGLVWYGTRK